MYGKNKNHMRGMADRSRRRAELWRDNPRDDQTPRTGYPQRPPPPLQHVVGASAATSIPILKSGKDKRHITSYRPIALTSHVDCR